MNLSAIFIKRPVTTTLLMLGILVFGGLAYQELPVADLPSVDFPAIRVSASLPGASAETVASSVARSGRSTSPAPRRLGGAVSELVPIGAGRPAWGMPPAYRLPEVRPRFAPDRWARAGSWAGRPASA